MDDELRGRLRDAALAHRPDRERMLARVERGMAQEPPGRAPRPAGAPMPWLRVVGATVAVCGVLAVGTLAVTSAVREDGGGQRVAGPPAPSASTAGASERGSALPAEAGPLRSDSSVDPHSNRYWAQSEVTVRTGDPLAALTVELRIALTGGVNTTGSWRSLPAQDFAVSAREESGFLVYRWTLKPGRTVPVGTHTFAGQYNHAEGARDASDDDYTARARAAGQQVVVGGDFAPAH
ncbi:hypothetical protein [Streptomyces sp. NPDC055749]